MSSQVRMVSSGEGSKKITSNEVRQRRSSDGETHTTLHIINSGTQAPQNQEETNPSHTPEKSLREPDTGHRILQLDKEGSISSAPVKVSESTHTGLISGQEGRTPSVIREKVSEDGYHWRKYGQKLVKGNAFVRSYYKCTHPGCQVKKQLVCSHDGQIADIVYFGQHDHPKPKLNPPLAIGFALSIVEEGPDPFLTAAKEHQAPCPLESTNTSQISTVTTSADVQRVESESNMMRYEVGKDDDPHSKKQKKGDHNVDPTHVDKPTSESRLVVQTLSEVDIVNDGYRWRKYGQKIVKGNLNPRSYYRCSSPGCPAKKHVERASHDLKVVITSYEGQHVHDMPPSRTVTPNIGSSAVQNSEASAKSGESSALYFNKVVSSNSSRNGKSSTQRTGESRSKSRGSGTRSDAVVPFSSGHGSKSSDQQNCNLTATDVSDAAGLVTVVNAEGRSNKQHKMDQELN